VIRFRHALKLARTKLQSKRLLLVISIVISSILFAVLIAAIIIFTGAENSAVNFVTKANDGVYRVEVNPVIPANVYYYDRPLSIETIRHIRAIEKQYYSQLAAKYKAAGLKYDASTEVSALSPSAYSPASLPAEQRFDITMDSPVIAYDQALKFAAYAKTAKNKLSDLQLVGAKYGATRYSSAGVITAQAIPNMMLIKNGKEDFTDTEHKSGDSTSFGYSTNSIHNGTYQLQDEALIQRYLLPPSVVGETKGIPVVVTSQEVASLFGKEKSIGPEPQASKEKAAWLQSIQAKFAGYTYQACYRNTPELAKIQQIQRDYADIINNKDTKGYVQPSLQYNLPTTGCGDITVKQDTRSLSEKKAAAQLIVDQKKLGTYIEPQHKTLTFQIVGIMNARHFSNYTANIQSYLQNLLAADNLTFSAFVPQQMYDKIPASLKFLDESSGPSSAYSQYSDGRVANGLTTHVLDFKTVNQARAFIDNETCPGYDSNCKKLFTSNPYGSNYLILDEIGQMFSRFMLYALPAVLGLAAVIIWFTMVRVMAENRKETAVYRAMGAKRQDIVAIYVTYGMIIALRVAIAASILGIGSAYVVDYVYGSQLTDIATASFGTITSGMRFSLFDLTSPYLLLVIASIFVVSLLAILQPLIRSVRRSPIEDMRSE